MTQVCSKCVCGVGLPGLEIGPDGVCNACVQDQVHPQNHEELTRMMEGGLEKLRAAPFPYHALVMISGGKDSAYVAWKLKETYGLRVLGFMVIHPFVNDLSKKNADAIAHKLGIDLLKYQADPEVWKKALKHGLQEGDKYGVGEMVGCGVCSALYTDVAMKIAVQMHIPLLATGKDYALEPNPVMVSPPDVKKSFLVDPDQAPSRRLIREALGPEHREGMFGMDFRPFQNAGFPAVAYPLTLMPYDYHDAINEMNEKGILPKKDSRSSDTNCVLLHLLGYMGFHRYGNHPYTRLFAQAMRRDQPSYLDQFFTNGDRRLDRDEHLRALDEYRQGLDYLADHPGATEEDFGKVVDLMPFVHELMGESLLPMVRGMSRMHEVAEFLEVDMESLAAPQA